MQKPAGGGRKDRHERGGGDLVRVQGEVAATASDGQHGEQGADLLLRPGAPPTAATPGTAIEMRSQYIYIGST